MRQPIYINFIVFGYGRNFILIPVFFFFSFGHWYSFGDILTLRFLEITLNLDFNFDLT